MGLTYDGGFNILNYIYNNVDDLGTGAVQDQIYNGFEIELQEADGTPYVKGTQNDSLLRNGTYWQVTNTFVYNVDDIVFPPLGVNDNSQTLTKFTLKMLQISGSPLTFATGTLNTPITVQKGETPIIYSSDLEIDFDIASAYSDEFTRKINDYVFLAQDSLSSVSQFKFTPFFTTAYENLSFFVAREDAQSPGGVNWGIVNQGAFAQAYNSKDLVLPLNDTGSSAVFNRVYMYYSQGTFPNETYVFAGNFVTITDQSTGNPTNYTILNGETGRFKTLELRINAK